MNDKTILVIEDDPQVIDLVSRQIADLGYATESAQDGKSGLAKALASDYSLVVIDLDLPELGGLEVCRQLREKKQLIPILILTGRSGEVPTILGLELGADEYMTKPFSVMEFRARVRSLLRRVDNIGLQQKAQVEGETEFIRLNLRVDFGRRQAFVDGVDIQLTPTEFDILSLLIGNQGRVFSRENIIEELWGFSNESYEQNIRSYISRLRSKIDSNPNQPPFIITVRGVGYRFSADEELEAKASS